MLTELQAAGWLPAKLNRGHRYRDRVGARGLLDPCAGVVPSDGIAAFYAARYVHSALAVWLERLAAGEIWCNGQQLWADGLAQAGDQLVWHRPPWQEAAVPVLPAPLFDDGDLVVINKPRGLPVVPAGGFLEHTLLTQLQQRHQADPLGLPRPVHRLGRFTSGLLVCARQSSSRAWMSAQLRESTGAVRQATADQAEPDPGPAKGCLKLYRALVAFPAVGSPLAQAETALGRGEGLAITTPIGRQPHPRLGQLWCAAAPGDPSALAARSWVRLLERRAEGWLVEVAIASGRPHQIRIHLAAAGAPLLGDPLYGVGGMGRPGALPGDGGYQLQAFRLELVLPGGGQLVLEAPEPLGCHPHPVAVD